MNIRIKMDDAAAVSFRFTQDPVDNVEVFSTITAAKARAAQDAALERDSWAACVREIRRTTLRDVQPEH